MADRPFLVRDYDGNAHHFPTLDSAVEYARGLGKAAWDGAEQWSIADQRTDARITVGPSTLEATTPIPPSAEEDSRWLVLTPGHPYDGQVITLLSTTGRVGGIGGGGTWRILNPAGLPGDISIYTRAILEPPV